MLVTLIFTAFIRLRLVEFPLERDEGEYAYAGQLLLDGIPPYCLAYNMKLPGTYLAYAGLMGLLGQTVFGIHFGLLLVTLATIGLVWLLTRDLFDELTGAVAAAAYAVLSTSSSVMGLAAHATHFVAFFGVAGVWVLWRALAAEKIGPYVAAGAVGRRLPDETTGRLPDVFWRPHGAGRLPAAAARAQRPPLAICLAYAAARPAF